MPARPEPKYHATDNFSFPDTNTPAMAKVDPASLLNHTTGRIGDLVVRQRGQQTLVQLRSRQPDQQNPSADQGVQRDRFKQAAQYAAKMLADPLVQEHYRQLGTQRRTPPNALLISNFLTPPSVDKVDTSAYHGRAGDLVRVLATDDIEVVSVSVTIRNAAGETIESGAAQKDHGVWSYTATLTVPGRQGLVIEAVARDRPANCAMKSVPLVL